MKLPTLTFEQVSAIVRQENGTLFWRVSRGGVRGGAQIVQLNKEGYITLSIMRRHLLAHRVVWLLVHGSWPVGLIDHRDRNRTNNHPDNIRAASKSANRANSPPDSGQFKGVTLHKDTGKFQAQCQRRYLGLFATPEEAAVAYDIRAHEVYGEFAWLNFPRAAERRAA